MISMKDIADKLNLSRTTVSNILNNNLSNRSYRKETIDKVLITAKEMGYIPNDIAKSLKTGSTKTIAIVVPDIANDFYVKIIKEIERLANEVDYSLIICIAEENLDKENNALRILKSKMVDGVLIAPVSYSQSLKEKEYPFKIVCYDRIIVDSRFPSVIIDNENISRKLVTKMLEESVSKPLFMAGSRYDYTVGQRLKGFKRALSDFGINFKSNNVIYDIYNDEIAYKTIKECLHNGEPKFDSIFLSTNFFIYGVLKALKEHSIDDLILGGFEDFRGSDLTDSKILKVHQPEKEIARLAFDLLWKSLNDEDTEDIVVYTKII